MQVLKVFVSYARKDCSEFAEELVAGLEAAGFEAFLDRHDIAAGEDWESRLANLIGLSDTVVFVVSPAAVKSERCAWEVSKAAELSKRLIPVVAIDVPPSETPENLSRKNYIFFNNGQTFGRSLRDLTVALKTDVEWVREHTRLGELATRWLANAKSEELLLRGPELFKAQRWMAAPTATLTPSDLHIQYIETSTSFEAQEAEKESLRLGEVAREQAEKELVLRKLSRRTTLALIGTGGLVAVAGGLAYWGTNAEARFNAERKRSEDAIRLAAQKAIEEQAARTDLTGQFIAYATGPGSVAMDGEGDNSPFSGTVLKNLAVSDTSLFDGIIRAQDEVLLASNGVQRPFISTDLNGEIYLGHPGTSRKLTALVVGASEYENVPRLKNPVNDAAAWSAFLRSSGFDVRQLLNPTRAELMDALGLLESVAPASYDRRDQQASIVRAGIVVPEAPVEPEPVAEPNSLDFFFYSGHGISIEGQEYLVPVDALGSTREEPTSSLVNLRDVADHLRRRAQASVLVLDANFPSSYR